ncbi:hypothetical protein [Streptomyces parvulus]|uniref:hypothetical protein n=1 Tax=Streptomyces parvulus TaxID=146923 RepID=UPI00342214F8
MMKTLCTAKAALRHGTAAWADQFGRLAERADVEGGQEGLHAGTDDTGPPQQGAVGEADTGEVHIGGAVQPQPDQVGDLGADAGQGHVGQEAGKTLRHQGVGKSDVAALLPQSEPSRTAVDF